MGTQGISTSRKFRERFERFSVVEQERKDATEQLLNEVDRLRALQQDTSDDLDRERSSCRSLQEQVRKLEAKTERRGFVAVLIDADLDDYLFRENFVNNGLEGGKQAADELCARINDYLKGVNIVTENLNIVVRAFANFVGLESACLKKGLLGVGRHIGPFVHGFTQRRGLFDFVDVGSGKENADYKIKDCLDLFANDYQCKHIILGVCHDSGYAPDLRDYASDLATRDKISLLEGGEMHASLKNLGFSHGPFKIEGVFAPSMRIGTGMSVSTSNTATEFTAMSNQNSGPLPKKYVNSEAKGFADKLKPQRDANGKRVDRKLKVDPDSNYLKALRKANLCGHYYLRGECDGMCSKNHVAKPLSSHEFDCLWYILRQNGQCFKFRKNKDCEDPLCFYGHQNSPQ